MSDSLFNTPSETATRLTLCLSLLPHPATLDEITVMDFAATYMKVMGFGNSNLHGDNPYVTAEYDARRKRVRRGLNRLVIIGFAITEDAGSSYSASPTCMQFANELHGEYVTAYRHAIETLATLNYDSIIERILESR